MSEPGTSQRAALHREGIGQRLHTDEGEHRGGGGTWDALFPAQRGSDVSIRVGTQNRSLTLPSGGRGCDVIFIMGCTGGWVIRIEVVVQEEW